MRPQLGKPKILKAAQDLFVEKGYFATSISQITNRAGVSKGLVYNYYVSKEELLVDLLESYTAKMKLVAETLGSSSNSSKGSFIDNFFFFLEKEKVFLKLQLSLMLMPELESVVREPIRTRSELLLKEITKEFKKKNVPSAKSKARVFLATLDGVALHYLSIYEDYPLASIKSELKKKLDNLYIEYTGG